MGNSDSNVEDPLNSGYRIYHLIKNGPLDNNGINELSDFIIPPLDVLENKISFLDWVTSNAGKKLLLKIYSLKTRNLRVLTINANEKNSKDGILGGSVRFENWSIAHKKVLHIVNVEKNSFGDEKLHLIPEDDYIIAVQPIDHQIISLNSEESDPLSILSMVIQSCKGKECNFYIYNIKKGSRKECAIIGSESSFKLGIEGAYGALHEFPFFDNDEIIHEKNNEKKDNLEGEIVQEKANENILNNNNKSLENKNDENFKGEEKKNETIKEEEKKEEKFAEKKDEEIKEEEKKEENTEEKKDEEIKEEENNEDKNDEEEPKEEESSEKKSPSSSKTMKRKKIKAPNN